MFSLALTCLLSLSAASGDDNQTIVRDGQTHFETVPSGSEISGDDRRGLLYGCYGLLEDVFGCRWHTAKISKIPRQPTLKVAEFDITQKPAFEYREPFYWEAFDRDWAVRNRVNGNAQRLDDSVGGKVMYGPFVHTESDHLFRLA